MFPLNKTLWGLIRGGRICKNDFLGGGLFEGGVLIRAWGLIRGFTVTMRDAQLCSTVWAVVRGLLSLNRRVVQVNG